MKRQSQAMLSCHAAEAVSRSQADGGRAVSDGKMKTVALLGAQKENDDDGQQENPNRGVVKPGCGPGHGKQLRKGAAGVEGKPDSRSETRR